MIGHLRYSGKSASPANPHPINLHRQSSVKAASKQPKNRYFGVPKKYFCSATIKVCALGKRPRRAKLNREALEVVAYWQIAHGKHSFNSGLQFPKGEKGS
jgi:hypothetical protein